MNSRLTPFAECEACLEWFHFACIGFSGSLEEAEDYHFVCPFCRKSSRRPSPDRQRTPEKAEFEASRPNGKPSKEKSLVGQKKEDLEEAKGKPETAPVCKRTRKQLVDTQVSISSSTTPRKESLLSPSKSARRQKPNKRQEDRKKTNNEAAADSEGQSSEGKAKKRKLGENVCKRLRKK